MFGLHAKSKNLDRPFRSRTEVGKFDYSNSNLTSFLPYFITHSCCYILFPYESC